MPKNDTIHVRVDENVKINAEKTLAMLGLTISKAVNMMLCQVNLTGGLPFPVKLPAPENVIVSSKADIDRKLDEAEQGATIKPRRSVWSIREKTCTIISPLT